MDEKQPKPRYSNPLRQLMEDDFIETVIRTGTEDEAELHKELKLFQDYMTSRNMQNSKAWIMILWALQSHIGKTISKVGLCNCQGCNLGRIADIALAMNKKMIDNLEVTIKNINVEVVKINTNQSMPSMPSMKEVVEDYINEQDETSKLHTVDNVIDLIKKAVTNGKPNNDRPCDSE